MADIVIRGETKRQRYLARLSQLKLDRDSYVSQWKDISDFMQPWRGRFFVTDAGRDRSNKKIIDNTGLLANRTQASGMMAGITSPARPWFKLESPDQNMMKLAPVKEWLHEVERRMRIIMGRSNLYNALHQMYGELGLFSTSALLVEEDDDSIIRAVPLTIGSYYLATSKSGRVDTMYREFRMTVRQVVDRFGFDAASQSVQSLYNTGSLDQWVDIVHLIEPNDERMLTKRDNRNLPFRSVYMEAGGISSSAVVQPVSSTPGKLLSESGYHEFPVIAPRWDVIGEDTYGSGSPGFVALGDCRALQVLQKMKAKAVAKMVDPPMNVPSSMKSTGYSIIPGAVNYIDVVNNGMPAAQAAINLNLPLNFVLEDIRENQDRINKAFFVDLFMLLANDTRSNVTAREIAERHEEKMLMLGPVLERFQAEGLDPLIDRVFGIMLRGGYLPEIPEELAGVDLRVEYISVMAQAQKLVGVGSIERMASFVGNLAGVQPDAIDKLDIDNAIDEYADALSAPPKMVRSEEDVQRIRQGRAEQQAIQQQAAAGMQAAQGAKLLSETDTGGDNALATLMQNAGLS